MFKFKVWHTEDINLDDRVEYEVEAISHTQAAERVAEMIFTYIVFFSVG